MNVITTSSIILQGGGLELLLESGCSTDVTFCKVQAMSECFPHTVRMHTRKVRVATITSHGWVEQNSPWDLNTFRTVVVSITRPCGAVLTVLAPTLK